MSNDSSGITWDAECDRCGRPMPRGSGDDPNHLYRCVPCWTTAIADSAPYLAEYRSGWHLDADDDDTPATCTVRRCGRPATWEHDDGTTACADCRSGRGAAGWRRL